jgi:hypothetical protein
MALTESSLVSLRALMASVLVHFVYYMTILMLSAESPYSETYSPAYSTFSAVVAVVSTFYY